MLYLADTSIKGVCFFYSFRSFISIPLVPGLFVVLIFLHPQSSYAVPILSLLVEVRYLYKQILRAQAVYLP